LGKAKPQASKEASAFAHPGLRVYVAVREEKLRRGRGYRADNPTDELVGTVGSKVEAVHGRPLWAG